MCLDRDSTKKNSNLLDLGSSPGGWTQVANKIIKNGKILSIDVKNMEPIKNVKFIKNEVLGNYIEPIYSNA